MITHIPLCFLICYCYVDKCADIFKFIEGLEMLIITTGILEIWVKHGEKQRKIVN